MTTKKSIKGTQTEKNLVIAYMAESAAYSRYMFYASKAKKEEYFPIEEAFTETANNELRHSKVYFKYLEGGTVPVELDVEAGVIGSTSENLAVAAEEEIIEGRDMYMAFAKTADKEGFADIAEHFRSIASIEELHHERFLRYKEQVDTDTVWKRDKPIVWKCLVCGYEHTGTEPPEECPACDHPYQHYMGIL